MVWAPVVVGLLLLGFGRRLYWLFVGATGFAIGLTAATRALNREPDLTTIVIALVVGLLGVVLAIFLQRIAVAIAGFLGGAWLAAGLWNAVAAQPAQLPWLPAIIGGVLGAAAAATLFDWALIVISSIVGAVLVAEYLRVSHGAQGALIAILAVVGVFVQAGGLRRAHAPPRTA
jgi:hypothetical protein